MAYPTSLNPCTQRGSFPFMLRHLCSTSAQISYAGAIYWQDLQNAVLNSATESSLDDMILLRHASGPTAKGPIMTEAKVVVYWKVDDIRRCLVSGLKPPLLSKARLTAGALERLWDYCRAESKEIRWLSTRHKSYFSGPLAYVLLYLAAAEDYIRSALEVQPSDNEDLRQGFLSSRSPLGILTCSIHSQGFTYYGDTAARGHNP
jgi:hypothetical protein